MWRHGGEFEKQYLESDRTSPICDRIKGKQKISYCPQHGIIYDNGLHEEGIQWLLGTNPW